MKNKKTSIFCFCIDLLILELSLFSIYIKGAKVKCCRHYILRMVRHMKIFGTQYPAIYRSAEQFLGGLHPILPQLCPFYCNSNAPFCEIRHNQQGCLYLGNHIFRMKWQQAQFPQVSGVLTFSSSQFKYLFLSIMHRSKYSGMNTQYNTKLHTLTVFHHLLDRSVSRASELQSAGPRFQSSFG